MGPLRPGERSAKVARSYKKTLSKTAKKEVKKIVLRNKELKSHIVQHSTLSPSTTWVYESNLMDITEGDSSTARDGLKIQGLRLKGRVSIVNGDSTNRIRLIVFRNDRNQSPTGLPGNVNGFFDDTFYQKNKLVYDRTFVLNSTYGGASMQKQIKFSISTKHLVEYGGAPAAYPTKGGYWIAAISDSGAAPNPAVNITTAFYYKEH